MRVSLNIAVCQSCAHLERPIQSCKFGQCRCTKDGQERHYIELCEVGECPLELLAKPDQAEIDAKPPRPLTWEQKGPQLWRTLHTWATTADLVTVDQWLEQFANGIGCCECKSHWLERIKQNPPDTSSREALFAWTVAAHNAVNARLGKPEMTVEAARNRWSF